MTWWFSIWMTFWERLVVGRWLQVWYTGHHFENCWLMLKRPPLEPKHFSVWWVFSFSILLDRFQRFRFFWCRFFWYDFWKDDHTIGLLCWRHFFSGFTGCTGELQFPGLSLLAVWSFDDLDTASAFEVEDLWTFIGWCVVCPPVGRKSSIHVV